VISGNAFVYEEIMPLELDPKKMTFLVVDDMDNMRRSVRAMLKLVQYGKAYHEAVNGKEAWAMLKNDEGVKFDFIISDWNMPKMNGTELLNLIRADKSLREIPFLMITAEANQSIVAEAAEQDVDAYLTKPFVTATLEQKIKELIHLAANPTPLTLLLRKASQLREKGNIDKAILCAKKAVEINARSSRPLRELGRLFLRKTDLKRAFACFKKAIELNRLDIPSYHYLGQISFKTGELDKAIGYFTKALELSPRHADRAFKIAMMLLDKKKYKEAEKILKIMLKNNSANIDLQEDVAEACLDHGLFDLAIKTYSQVLTEDPERSYLKKPLGMAYMKGGHLQEAVDIFERIIANTPEDIELLIALAQTYLDLKVRMRADKWASKAVRIDPANKEAQKILDQCG